MTQEIETKQAEPEPESEPKPVRTSAFLEEGIVESAENIEVNPETYKWKALVIGPSGSGKSTLAAQTLPGKKLLIECDGRKETVVGIPNVDIYTITEPDARQPRAWKKLETLRRVIIGELNRGIFPYDSLILDGLTMMGRFSMNWALLLDLKHGLGGSPAKQHYGPQMDNLAKYVLSTLSFPLHICYTGHEELITDEERGVQRYYPKITGKLRTEISNWFNETYYSYRAEDKDAAKLRYYLLTAGSGRREFFKSSLNTLGRFWKDPIEVDFDAEGPHGFEDLWERRFKGEREEGVEDNSSEDKSTT